MTKPMPSKYLSATALGVSIVALGMAVALVVTPADADQPESQAAARGDEDHVRPAIARVRDAPVQGSPKSNPTRAPAPRLGPEQDREDSEDSEDSSVAADPDLRCALDQPSERCSHLEPSQKTLDEMARCGVVRFDMPAFMMSPKWEPDPDEDWAKEVGLTPSERDELAVVGREFRDEFYADMLAHARLAGIEESFPDETPLIGIVTAISEAYGEEPTQQSMGKVAKQRAGWTEPPGPEDAVSHQDEFAQRFSNLGEDYEGAVAQALGEKRAAELRHARDGWPGLRIRTGHDCGP